MERKKITSILLLIAFVFQLFYIKPLKVEANTNLLPKIRILEIQPGDVYDLNKSMFNGLANVELVQMPMSLFNATFDEINGKYDIVYVGNKIEGKRYKSRIDIPVEVKDSEGFSAYESSENDITNKRAGNEQFNTQYGQIYSINAGLIKFIKTGQLTLFSKSILDDKNLVGSKLYSNFIDFRNNSSYPNFVEISSINARDIINKYNQCKKRPSLLVTSKPKTYDGSDASYTDNRLMSFTFNMNGNSNMVARLYFDINGDGMFKPNEKIVENEPKPSGDNYTISYRLPDDFTGLMPWKLEIEDVVTSVKNYEIGYTAIKGIPLKIRVLQLIPNDKNTFSIKSKTNKLYKDGVYDISVTEMNITDFQNNYPNPCKDTSGKTVPTVLNGNYDMIIFGFADIYGGYLVGNPRDYPNATKAIEDFIKTGQSVMLTHDTIWKIYSDKSITDIDRYRRYFADVVGQSIYKDIEFNLEEKNIYGEIKIPHDKTNISQNIEKNNFFKLNQVLPETGRNLAGRTYTTQTQKINNSMITMFPFKLNNVLTVAQTHAQYYQLNLEDEDVIPWYSLNNNNNNSNNAKDPRNFYYTYSKGTITYSGTGHSTPNDNDELNLFINTIVKAARTANHAPILELNLEEGQTVSKQQDNFEFMFTANDVDLDPLTGYVYINGQEVKKYNEGEIQLGVPKKVSFTKSDLQRYVSSTSNTFKVKVKVVDKKGAYREAERTLNYVANPVVSVQVAELKEGYLTGDTAKVKLIVTAEKSTETGLKNLSPIKLNYGSNKIEYDSTAIQLNSLLSLDNVTYTWDNTKNVLEATQNGTQVRELEFKLDRKNPPGVRYQVNGEINYSFDKIPGNFKANFSFPLNVVSGVIDVKVTDEDGAAMKEADVIITKPDGTVITRKTDATGFVTVEDLSSGTYKVKAKVSGKYTEGGEKTINLSFKNPKSQVDIKMLDLRPVVKIQVTDDFNTSVEAFDSKNALGNAPIIKTFEPVQLRGNGKAKFNISAININGSLKTEYAFIKVDNKKQVPQYTPNNYSWTVLQDNSAYNNINSYLDLMLDKKGYLTVKHYEYAGNYASDTSVSREVSFAQPLGSDSILIQKAEVPPTDSNTLGGGKGVFNEQQNGYIFLENANAFREVNINNLTDAEKARAVYKWNKWWLPMDDEGAHKAMKVWGYFVPKRSGSYKFAIESDDGAYGYLIINGVKNEFVNDWTIAAAFNRTNNATFNLEEGKAYPIYMEWFEGCPSHRAFIPKYSLNGGDFKQIPKEELYASSNSSPGNYAAAYFEDSAGVNLPNEDGIYYIAVRSVNNVDGERVITEGLYGGFIIDKTPPEMPIINTVMGDDKINKSEQNNVTITGTAEANSRIIITIADEVDTISRETMADNNGNYSVSGIDVSRLREGNLQVSAIAIDAAQNQSETATRNVLKDTIPPAKPIISFVPTVNNNAIASKVIINYPSDAWIKQYKEMANGQWNNYSAPFVITSQKDIYAKCQDEAGNWSNEAQYNVEIIELDKYMRINQFSIGNLVIDGTKKSLNIGIGNGQLGSIFSKFSEYEMNINVKVYVETSSTNVTITNSSNYIEFNSNGQNKIPFTFTLNDKKQDGEVDMRISKIRFEFNNGEYYEEQQVSKYINNSTINVKVKRFQLR